MAVTTVGTSTGSGTFSSGTGPSITKPSGIANGDVLWAIIGFNSGTAITWGLPTGWTQDAALGNANGTPFLVAHKVITNAGGEPASYGFTQTSGGTADGGYGIIAQRGVDNTTPFLGVSTELDFSSTSFTIPAVSWAGAADAIAMIPLTWQSSTSVVTWPSGMNNSPDGFTANDGFEWCVVGVNLTTVAAVTSLPSKAITMSVGEFGAGAQVAIKVASAAAAGMPPMPQAVRRRLLRAQSRVRLPIAAPDLIPAPVRLRRYAIPTAHSRVQMVPAPITTAPPPSSYVPPIPQHRKIVRPPHSRIVAAPVAPPNPPLPVVRRRVIIPVVHSRVQMVPAPITTAPAQSVYITSFRRQRYLIFTAHSRVQMVPAPITVAPVTTVTVVPPGIRRRHTPMYWYRWLWSTLLEELPFSE